MGPPSSSRADVPTLLDSMVGPLHVRDCNPLWGTLPLQQGLSTATSSKVLRALSLPLGWSGFTRHYSQSLG